ERLDARAQGIGGPAVEETPGPTRRRVAPEGVEVLLEQVGSYCAEVGPKQLGEAPVLSLRQSMLPFQEDPTRLGESHTIAALAQGAGLDATDLVDGLAEQFHDVKPVEHVYGGTRSLR